MAAQTIIFEHFGDIERGLVLHRRRWGGTPSYNWHSGYCRLNAKGERLHPPVTRKEAYAEARSEGKRAKFIRAETPTQITPVKE
jgi:hypothetical protein